MLTDIFCIKIYNAVSMSCSDQHNSLWNEIVSQQHMHPAFPSTFLQSLFKCEINLFTILVDCLDFQLILNEERQSKNLVD